MSKKTIKVQAVKATIVAEKPNIWEELPEYVKAGIKKGQEQARNGETKSYEEVKKILSTKYRNIK